MRNLLFKHATVLDGTGSPSFKGDVLCQNGMIVLVGDAAGAGESAAIIDADGLCLSPGFIDIHSHSDTVTLIDPRAYSKVAQGVTTDVSGQCGMSAAPLGSRKGPAARAVEASLADYGVALTWLSYGEYLAALEDRGMSCNIAGLVGHGTLRSVVIGDDARPATREDVANMAGLLMDALMEGAFGLSSGLEYPPGFFADAQELSGVAAPVAKRGGIYATHMREEGEEMITSVNEAIAVARDSGARLQISHLKAVGPSNFGRVKEALGLLEKANREGIDAAADVYPYTASSTSLGIVLPEWAHDGAARQLLRGFWIPTSALSSERLPSCLRRRTVGGTG